MIDARPRILTPPQKSALVNSFLSGKNIADICVIWALHRLTVEQVLREAIHHLSSFVNEDAEKLAALAPPSEGTSTV